MTTTADAKFDVEALRQNYPSLRSGVAHFDGPGGSQTPGVVGEMVGRVMTSSISNRGRVTAAERVADDIVTHARQALADFMNTDPDTVVFGRSMTALTFDFARTLAKNWARGDEVVVSRLDHDANVRPWVLAAEAVGATVRWIDFDPASGELTVDDVAAVVGERTRVVAVTAASNLIGTRPQVRMIADLVHSVGALLYVDGVHFAAHSSVDFHALGADFFTCSPYKFGGPHCGVLTGRGRLLEELMPDKLLPSSDRVPERFEFGTLPYELLAGSAAAVDFMAESVLPASSATTRRERLVAALAAIETHEEGLRQRLEGGITALPGVTLHSRARHRTPTLLLTFDQAKPTAVNQFLAARGVNAGAGTFYALEPAQRMGLVVDGGLRVGLAPYTNDSDVDRLLAGLTDFLARA